MLFAARLGQRSESTRTQARSLHSTAVNIATLSPQIPGPANRICKHDFALSVNSDNGNGGDGGLARRISAPQVPATIGMDTCNNNA